MGDTPDQTISAEEMAEIDAAIGAMHNEQSADPLVPAYTLVLNNILRRLENPDTFTMTDAEIEAHTDSAAILHTELWQMNVDQPGILVDYVDPESEEVILAVETAIADIPRPSEEMRQKQSRNEIIIDRFTEQVDGMKGFSLKDAVNLVSSEESATEIRTQFKDVDPNILMASAYIMLDARRDELSTAHPEFAAQHGETDFLDMASVNIFYTSKNTKDYKFWNYDRQNSFIQAVVKNDAITSRLEDIKSPINLTSREDIQQQYTARAELVDLITEEFSKAYGLKDLTKDDMFFAYKSVDDYSENSQIAVAYSSTIGTKNDESILVTYNPIADAVRTHTSTGGMGLSDESSLTAFLKTTIEELQHTADNMLADQLLNGEMDKNHPAYNHISLHILNTMHYVNADHVEQENYEAQHTERTAKIASDGIAFEIIFQTSQALESASAAAQYDNDKNDEPAAETNDVPSPPSDQLPIPSAPVGSAPMKL